MNINTFVTDLTRRDFLKLSGTGFLSLLISPHISINKSSLEQQGRVSDSSIKIYDIPSFKGKEIRSYWKDMILSISEATIGDAEPPHNRVWYYVENQGYTHSGAIQPVKTILNPIITDIPQNGALAEVTVPYTDAHWKPNKNFPVAYRLYYNTTHWVYKTIHDDAGNPWYQIQDDKWDQKYYTPCAHLRIVPITELSPLSPEIPLSGKRLEIRTAEQIVIAYEWDKPVFMARTATGARFSNGNFTTPPGRHFTYYKRPSRHMAAGNLAYNGFDLPGVPWVCYFTESGISFHGTYWHNNYGRPRSHGCINLTPSAAKWIYRWTLPYVFPDEQSTFEDKGTIVDVFPDDVKLEG